MVEWRGEQCERLAVLSVLALSSRFDGHLAAMVAYA